MTRTTSDARGLLIQEMEKQTGIMERFSSDLLCIEHTGRDLVVQRVNALVLGHEDLNYHDPLRDDALMAVLVQQADLTSGAALSGAESGRSPGWDKHGQSARADSRHWS